MGVGARQRAGVHPAYDVLGFLPPTHEPRATGHVPEMVALMQRLIDRGHAYAVDGDVYFDVRSFPAYGELSGQKIDDLDQGDTETDAKRDPRDFALWKAHKHGEPSWATPWGRGRPGWHLECSAMASAYLGAEFDIHGGGLDLLFPHHENEQAQSRAAGDGFAQYWLHNGWVTLGGEKMCKSMGNTLWSTRWCERVRPVELRFYLLAPHYRSTIEFTDAALEEAVAATGGWSPSSRARRAGRRRSRARCAPSSLRRSTTTWARPPPSPPSTRPSARATPHWPTATTPPARGGRLGARDARRPRSRPARPAVGARGDEQLPT